MDAHGFEVAAGAPPVLPAQTLTANQPPTSQQPPAAGLTTPQKGQSRVSKPAVRFVPAVTLAAEFRAANARADETHG